MKVKKKSALLRASTLQKIKKTKQAAQGESSVKKAVKNVKKILKKKQEDDAIERLKSIKTVKPKGIRKPFKPAGGIVYLGHIPHGFYEEEMKEYFEQFGKVWNVRVARSKNTGCSRGYGYVKFQHPDVARVAAETMNNYLMCGRLLKAAYIPPEKQHIGFFFGKAWSKQKYPKLINRDKITHRRNAMLTAEANANCITKSLKKLNTLENKLKEKGIDLRFQATDAPET
ncbi:hypothetical protein KM043_016640 [Ampulex compressa]|nr:hypothetical protein KM043_016640 [Ampulex compressa]